jgi:predicted nucleic acid-binding protein
VILIDSNVPMYLVGADHPHKADAKQALERLVSRGERLVTNAEVFQEILHRFAAIDRRDAIGPTFDALRGVVDEVLAIEERDVTEAKNVLLESTNLSARDALHVAVMRRHRIPTIMSFDRGFDVVAGLARIPS